MFFEGGATRPAGEVSQYRVKDKINCLNHGFKRPIAAILEMHLFYTHPTQNNIKPQ